MAGMPLNWIALYPQIPRLVEAEVARRLRLAEQVSAVADELTKSWPAQGEGQSAPAPPPNDRQIALMWLGAAVHAWEAVLECHPAGSPAYQAGWQQRQRFQQALLALLRQGS
jgi:hypothetical protein